MFEGHAHTICSFVCMKQQRSADVQYAKAYMSPTRAHMHARVKTSKIKLFSVVHL